MADKVFKAGISNTVFIWHASEGACEKCKALDEKEYSRIDDIPDRPHPNCKCYIEEKLNDELCDCADYYEQLQQIVLDYETLGAEVENEMESISQILSDTENMTESIDETLDILLPQYGKHLPECEYNIDPVYAELSAQKFKLEILMKDIYGFLYPLQTIYGTVISFVTNYILLLSERDGSMDKFYHSKANCEAAQRGILGSLTADGLSNLKELYDSYTYIHTHKVSVEEAIADSQRDQVANHEGRRRGREYPTCSCEVLMWDLRPPHRK